MKAPASMIAPSRGAPRSQIRDAALARAAYSCLFIMALGTDLPGSEAKLIRAESGLRKMDNMPDAPLKPDRRTLPERKLAREAGAMHPPFLASILWPGLRHTG